MDGRNDRMTDGWTDKRGSRNSYLDVIKYYIIYNNTKLYEFEET